MSDTPDHAEPDDRSAWSHPVDRSDPTAPSAWGPPDAPGPDPDERSDWADRSAPEEPIDPEPSDTGAGADDGDAGPSVGVRDDARRAIEAIVMVGEQPLDVNLLGQLLELRPAVVEELCRELADEYEREGRGFQLARVAGGWRFQSHPDQAPYVERFVLAGQTAKLSAAALETLAIVAYKQPISRAQVASIRGVSVDGVMRTLQQRGYIAEIGRDPGPGQAVMFGTTRSFLEKLGLDSLEQLPALGDFVPGAAVVEQLERGLRPEPSVHERLGALETTNSQRDDATKLPNGTGLSADDPDRDLDEVEVDDIDDDDGPARPAGSGNGDHGGAAGADGGLGEGADVDDDLDGPG